MAMEYREYAGFSSRETPQEIIARMGGLGRALEAMGWRARTGVTTEGDARAWGPLAHRMAPWKGAGDGVERESEHWVLGSGWAAGRLYAEARRHEPAWNRMSPEQRALRACQAAIVLGPELDRPVRAVIGWANPYHRRDPAWTLRRVAMRHRIAVLDVGEMDDRAILLRMEQLAGAVRKAA